MLYITMLAYILNIGISQSFIKQVIVVDLILIVYNYTLNINAAEATSKRRRHIWSLYHHVHHY